MILDQSSKNQNLAPFLCFMAFSDFHLPKDLPAIVLSIQGHNLSAYHRCRVHGRGASFSSLCDAPLYRRNWRELPYDVSEARKPLLRLARMLGETRRSRPRLNEIRSPRAVRFDQSLFVDQAPWGARCIRHSDRMRRTPWIAWILRKPNQFPFALRVAIRVNMCFIMEIINQVME